MKQFLLDALQGFALGLVVSLVFLFIPILWLFIPFILILMPIVWPFVKVYKRQEEEKRVVNPQIRITFDKQLAHVMLQATSKYYKKHRIAKRCRYCKTPITNKNLGLMDNKGYVCQSLVCLIQYSDSIKKKGVKKNGR